MSGSGPDMLGAMVRATHLVMAGTWQMAIGGAPGDIVEDYAELEQSLRIVLETPEKSIPGRPLFGARLHQYVDKPVTEAGPLIVQEVFRAVGLNEPRITVLDVTPTLSELGQLELEIRWQPTKPLERDARPTRATRIRLG